MGEISKPPVEALIYNRFISSLISLEFINKSSAPEDYINKEPSPSLSLLTDLVIREVLINFHLRETGTLAGLFRLLTYMPAKGFAGILQRIDRDARLVGLHGAACIELRHFVTRLEIRGWATPSDGPLIIAANHPGGTDPFVMTAAIPREDLHILAQDHIVFHALPNIKKFLICMAEDRSDAHLALLRTMDLLKIHHSILVYPGGDLELDPALFPGSDHLLREWSSSLSFILSRMPEVMVQPVILRGTISMRAWKSWLTKLGRTVTDRLQIAMIAQITFQQLKHDAYPVQTTLIKGPSLTARELDKNLDPLRIQSGLMAVVNEILASDPAKFPLLEEINPVAQ